MNKKIRELEELIDAQAIIIKVEKRLSIIDKKSELVNKMPLMPSISREKVTDDLSNITKDHSKLVGAVDEERRNVINTTDDNISKKMKIVEAEYNTSITKVKDRYTRSNEISRGVYTRNKENMERSITTLTRSIEELERSKEIHLCPHCKGSIRYNHGKIEPSSSSPFDEDIYSDKMKEIDQVNVSLRKIGIDLDNSIKKYRGEENDELLELKKKYNKEVSDIKAICNDARDKKLTEIEGRKKELETKYSNSINNLQSALNTYITIQSIKESIDGLDNELNLLPVINLTGEYKKLSIRELGSAKSILDELKLVKIINPSVVTSSYMKKCNEWHKYNNDLTQVGNDISQLKVVEYVDDVKIDINKYEYSVIEQERLNREIIKVEKDIKAIPTHRLLTIIEGEIKSYQDELDDVKDDIDRSNTAVKVKCMYDKLMDKSSDVDSLYNRLVKLKDFKMDVQKSLTRISRRISRLY